MVQGQRGLALKAPKHYILLQFLIYSATLALSYAYPAFVKGLLLM